LSELFKRGHALKGLQYAAGQDSTVKAHVHMQ